jgi:hypothetical protein
VPKIHKDTIIKEVERLCELGVLERQPASEWALPSFVIPKIDRTVCFFSDFWEVNKRLVRTPFPIPKISTVFQEIEGDTFATALELNMRYYTIRLDPDTSKICTIIFPWGKYSYKRLPMGIAGSPDIFQGKVPELMESLEYVRAYLDDLLCISKLSLEDHLEKLEEVLRRLRHARLKVNAAKSTFCAHKIEYLEYVLTGDGIKPQSNKVQTILVIKPPMGVKQLRLSKAWYNITMTLVQDRAKCSPPSPHWLGSLVRPKPIKLKGPKIYPGIGIRFIKEHSIT